LNEAVMLRNQLESLNSRIRRLEERFDKEEREKFEEARRERELFIPDKVWEKIPADVKTHLLLSLKMSSPKKALIRIDKKVECALTNLAEDFK